MSSERFDFEGWVERNAKRIGVGPEKLRKAFVEQFEKETDKDAPLDVPDRWIATYHLSYGGHSRFFREILFNKKLVGAKCPECGKVYCPPRAHCPDCWVKTEWVPLSGRGTVESFTTIFMGTSASVRRFPFICAYIKLEGTDTAVCASIEMEAVFKDERNGLITDFYFKSPEE